MIKVWRAIATKKNLRGSLLTEEILFCCNYRADALQRLEVKRRGASATDLSKCSRHHASRKLDSLRRSASFAMSIGKVRTIDSKRSGEEMAHLLRVTKERSTAESRNELARQKVKTIYTPFFPHQIFSTESNHP